MLNNVVLNHEPSVSLLFFHPLSGLSGFLYLSLPCSFSLPQFATSFPLFALSSTDLVCPVFFIALYFFFTPYPNIFTLFSSFVIPLSLLCFSFIHIVCILCSPFVFIDCIFCSSAYYFLVFFLMIGTPLTLAASSVPCVFTFDVCPE